MFDLKAALANVNGAQYDFSGLEELLGRIRRENLGEISPEVGTRELLIVALQGNWIREDDNGQFHIELPKVAA
jgi:hypothetical protein